ncbi:MAG: hypothetical protein KJ601_01815 [Nanoarchaeota archaeon]|nr:hypothetical protein [Nanoarchaeota archaeon]MBU1704736.1 hypothetical protein [Nanoarchaeota archaeon]
MEDIIYLFDVDGVIAETPHEEAWRQAAIEWGGIDSDYDFTAFYAARVAGEPGLIGAKNILAELRQSPCDRSLHEKKGGDLGQLAEDFRNAKQVHIDQLIGQDRFRVFDDVAKIIMECKDDTRMIGAVSSSENARTILQKIKVDKIAGQIGFCYPANTSLYDLFDATALGTITYWKGNPIEKVNHYAMAYGVMLGALGVRDIPSVVVFEDAPKGITAVNQLGFYSIGISRISTSGKRLASKDDLYKAGADLVFDEPELAHQSYCTIDIAVNDLINNKR